MSIGVAILGSGIFVKEEHLPAVLSTPALTLKAIFSRTHASASALASTFSLPPSTDFYSLDSPPSSQLPALLARPDIHAVIIALPIPDQPTYIRAALQAGKHVLSEKPIAPTLATATSLLAFHSALPSPHCLWSVAENFRFLPRFRRGATEAAALGRALGLRLRVASLVAPGGKYFETAWRKTPAHQGGFLLDGGVHHIVGMRVLLGGVAGERIAAVTGFAARGFEHLPPVDTVDGAVRLGGGGCGTVAMSYGTTFGGAEWVVACEGGTVEVRRDRVVVVSGGETREVMVEDAGSGVALEVKAWAEAIGKGVVDEWMSPEEALADLEVLEALLQSGGAAVTLNLQT